MAESLRHKLIEHGHEAIVMKIPFQWHPSARIIESMLACQLMRVPNADRVIALKFPAYYIPHPNKRLWLLHQFRQAYDLWGTPYQDIPDSDEGRKIRDVIHQSDNALFGALPQIYTNSHVVSERLKKFNSFDSKVLYPPLEHQDEFFCASYGDTIFYPSRISGGKRQLLVVQSMKYVTSGVKLILAGLPESTADLADIEKAIEKDSLQDRVHVMPRFISQEEKVSLFSTALACAYTPYDEDSYGYVTLESYHARKPVITCSDSGGTLLTVKHGSTGCVVSPDPRAIAESINMLAADKTAAKRMGEAGWENLTTLDITWNRVIRCLTE